MRRVDDADSVALMPIAEHVLRRRMRTALGFVPGDPGIVPNETLAKFGILQLDAETASGVPFHFTEDQHVKPAAVEPRVRQAWVRTGKVDQMKAKGWREADPFTTRFIERLGVAEILMEIGDFQYRRTKTQPVRGYPGEFTYTEGPYWQVYDSAGWTGRKDRVAESLLTPMPHIDRPCSIEWRRLGWL